MNAYFPFLAIPTISANGPVAPFRLKRFPIGVLVGPELMRHGLVHDGDERRLVIITFLEDAPAQQRNSHGIEIRCVHMVIDITGGGWPGWGCALRCRSSLPSWTFPWAR